MRSSILSVAALVLAGCRGLVPLPEQQPVVQAPDPPDPRFLVRVVVPSAARRIVKDIGGAPALFRWTGAEPTVKLKLPDGEPWLAQMEFAVVEATLKDTGPVTVSLWVNDREIGKARYEKPGEQTLAIPLPKEVLPNGGEATLMARIDPVWVAPTDGARLGVLLKALGFVRP